MKAIVHLIGKEIKDVEVKNFEKFVLYTNLKLKKNVVVGKSKRGKMKRLYLWHQDDNKSELLEGVDYNMLQVSVYKKIIITHEKS